MVSHYLTIKLIGREHIPHRKTFHTTPCETMSYPVLITVSGGYPKVRGRLLTCYSPVRRSSTTEMAFPLDLHVLSTPPAFVLSQDQTLHRKTKPPHQPKPAQGKESHIPRQTTNNRQKILSEIIADQRNQTTQPKKAMPKGAKQTNSSTMTHC